MNSFFPRGAQILSTAVAADEAKNYPDALRLYILAFEHFLTGLKYCKNDRSKAAVRQKLGDYLSRAEAIKAFLERQKQGEKGSQKSAALNESDGDKQATSAKKGPGKHNREPDEALRHALSSTILTEKPKLSWKDVAGLKEAKQALEEAVLLPQKFPQMFVGERKPWKGILLYGPPGTGKSHVAKVIASISDATFYSVSSADLVSKYFGESEKLIRELFVMASQSKPSIIFIDEIDAICGKRGDGDESTNRMKTEFLTCMQDILDDDGVLVLAATNRPFDLDAAVRRRFEKRIYIPLPDEEAREKLFEIHLGDEASKFDQKEKGELVGHTDGYSGSDIAILCRDALMQPVRECVRSKWWVRTPDGVRPCSEHDEGAFRADMMELPSESLALPDTTMTHFEKSLHNVKSSVNPKELAVFDEFTSTYGTMKKDEELEEEEEGKEKEKEKEKENDDGQEPQLKKPRNVTATRQRKGGKSSGGGHQEAMAV